MNFRFTYQQDTLKVKDILNLSPENNIRTELKVERTVIPLDSIPERKITEQIVKTEEPAQSGNPVSNISSKTRRTEKMQSDEPVFIEPKKEIQFDSIATVTNPALQLPANEIKKINTDWLTILVLLVLVLFASLRNSYSKYLANIFQSLINYPTAYRMYMEKNYSVLHAAYRLEIIYYITFSIFIFQAVTYFQLQTSYTNLMLYLICFVAVTGYFLLKKLAYLVLGSLFEGTIETAEFLFNMDNFNRIAGLFLFPVILLIAYNPWGNPAIPLILGIVTIIFFYLLLLQRGIAILLKKQFPIYYLFLYLCSLEFLPLLLIFKIVVV